MVQQHKKKGNSMNTLSNSLPAPSGDSVSTSNLAGSHPLVLSETIERFVLHWGEMGSKWGVNRTVGQIHGLLFVLGRPLPAEDIAEYLRVARSNVSNSLKELQSWDLVKVMHLRDDRRDHFETSKDPWELFKAVVRERKLREFDPTAQMLKQITQSDAFSSEDRDLQKRVKDTLGLMSTLSVWGDQMLKLEPQTLLKIMRMGVKIKNFIS
jgi:DNA-binding transcriptional regulator GbsR (MarR family)